MMPIAEQSGGQRARLARFTGLGAITGAVTAAVCMGVEFHWATLYVAPGLVFGLAFGTLMQRQRLLRLGRAALYGAAAITANAAAVVTAIWAMQSIEAIIGGGRLAGVALSGSIAGAVGGGLLAAAAMPPLRLARWPLLVIAGAVLGTLLPLFTEGRDVGILAFYMIWQAGYAAALAAALPRIEAI